MARTSLHFWTSVALAASFCLPACAQAASAQTSSAMDVAIVVHPDTPVSTLSLADVRRVFLGERQYWKPQLPVVLLVRAPVSYERDVVLRVIYQMTEPQFKQYWIAKIFRAEATSGPKIVYSNDVASQLVGAIPGAVGFMSTRDVRTGLKVLQVDGRLPGEPGYALR